VDAYDGHKSSSAKRLANSQAYIPSILPALIPSQYISQEIPIILVMIAVDIFEITQQTIPLDIHKNSHLRKQTQRNKQLCRLCETNKSKVSNPTALF
jgi:hypothetical protein